MRRLMGRSMALGVVLGLAVAVVTGFGLLGTSPLTALAGGDFEKGMAVYQNQDYPMAVYYLRRAAKLEPENPNIHYYLADALVKVNRLEDAQNEYQRILTMAPYSTAAKMSRVNLVQLKAIQDPFIARQVARGGSNTFTSDKLYFPRVVGPHYFNQVPLSGQVVRWAVTSFPLRVYVEDSPRGVSHYKPGFAAVVKESLDLWSQGLDHQLRYVVVQDPNHADIRVSWVDSLDTKGRGHRNVYTAGITVPKVVNNQLQRMEMRLSTHDVKGRPLSEAEIYRVAVHEMGHALGISGHSEYASDIMYPSARSAARLSQRDINTIRLLYGQTADITSEPFDESKLETASYKLDRQRRFNQSLRALEQEVKRNPNHLAFLNLSGSYFQKGRMLDDEAKNLPVDQRELEHKKALVWYHRGLKAVNQSLEMEPQQPYGYYNRSLIHQAFGKYEHSLRDINKAIGLSSEEARFYLDKAFILAQLGRKGEAQTSLNKYKAMNPGQSQSAEVKAIERRVQ